MASSDRLSPGNAVALWRLEYISPSCFPTELGSGSWGQRILAETPKSNELPLDIGAIPKTNPRRSRRSSGAFKIQMADAVEPNVALNPVGICLLGSIRKVFRPGDAPHLF